MFLFYLLSSVTPQLYHWVPFQTGYSLSPWCSGVWEVRSLSQNNYLNTLKRDDWSRENLLQELLYLVLFQSGLFALKWFLKILLLGLVSYLKVSTIDQKSSLLFRIMNHWSQFSLVSGSYPEWGDPVVGGHLLYVLRSFLWFSSLDWVSGPDTVAIPFSVDLKQSRRFNTFQGKSLFLRNYY